MKQLTACMKKEFLELLRRKKLFIFIGLALGFVALNIVMIYLLSGLLEMIAESMEEEVLAGVMLTMSNSVGMYNSYMQVYYVIPCMFLLMGTVSKEIKQKKWILPVSSGIRTQNLVAAKLIVLLAAVILPLVTGFLLNALVSVLAFEQDIEIGTVMLSGLGLTVYALFYCTFCICMSAITKNSALAVLIPLAFLLIGESILGVLKIANYTPALFTLLISNIPVMGMGTSLQITAAQWASAATITAACIAALAFFAVNNRSLSTI